MDIIQQLRDRAYAFKAPDKLLEKAADEIERLYEAIDNIGEDGDEVIWRDRDEVEFLTSKEWIVKASNELRRLRGVIDTYVGVCEAGAREINGLRHERDRLAAELVHLRHSMGITGPVTEPMPETPVAEET